MCTFLRPVKSEKKTTTHTKNKEGTRAHCFHCVPTQREREKNLSSIIDEGLFRCRCCCFLSLSLSLVCCRRRRRKEEEESKRPITVFWIETSLVSLRISLKCLSLSLSFFRKRYGERRGVAFRTFFSFHSRARDKKQLLSRVRRRRRYTTTKSLSFVFPRAMMMIFD